MTPLDRLIADLNAMGARPRPFTRPAAVTPREPPRHTPPSYIVLVAPADAAPIPTRLVRVGDHAARRVLDALDDAAHDAAKGR